MDDNKRLLLALVLSTLVMLAWMAFFSPTPEPAEPNPQGGVNGEQTQTADGPGAAMTTPLGAPASVDRETALAERRSIRIETPALKGSIRLDGARIDDLELMDYRQEVDDNSPPVVLLRPSETESGYYAFHGWRQIGADDADTPGINTPWQQVDGDVLTPETPISLSYANDDGLFFTRTISVDEHYMFTITDEVANNSGEAATFRHFGAVLREGIPDDLTNFMILHEGAVGVFNDAVYQRKYKKLAGDQRRAADDRSVYAKSEPIASDGWLGFTDKYWLTALIAPQIDGGSASVPAAEIATPGDPLGGVELSARAGYRVIRPADENTATYTAETWVDGLMVAQGEKLTVTAHMFAGAKDVALLNGYREDIGINKFQWAVDWGRMAGILTKPFFYTLDTFQEWTGSFGLAILMLTIVVKAVFFPLANASYKSMAKMKKLQPKMTKMRERHKDDPQVLQRKMLELYKKEKVNPLAGCLPLIPQMFVFFALYKTLFVTIEMRHAPFFGWIQDLSAPDPTNVWNLFGLIPYDPASVPLIGGLIGAGGFLALGAWPIIMGISMWAMQTLNPPPPDPMQARIFGLMPIIFTFVLAGFAAGLVIYWTWNNILSFLQQYIIIRRQKVDTPIGSFLARNYERMKKGEMTPATMAKSVNSGFASAGRRLKNGAQSIKDRFSGAGR